MPNILIVLIVSLTLMSPVLGQQLTLSQCQKAAEQLSPLKKQEQYLASLNELNQQIVQTNWLPGIDIKGRASYQSDVFKLPISMPGADIPNIPKDQYQLTLNLNQNLYDGGSSRAYSQLENAKTQVQTAQLKASLFQIEQIINELYFGILNLDKSAEINESAIKELNNQLNRATSAVKNGILLPSELKSLKKQKLTILQQQNELKMRKAALLKILGEWIGENLSVETTLKVPATDDSNGEIARPELTIFSNRIGQLQAQQSLLSTQLKPKLIAFAQAGYGSPNPYNFFETDWNTFYMVGGQLQWKPWDWNRTKKQREILKIYQEVVLSEQENFEKNISNQLIEQQSEIELLQSSLTTDKELLELQEDITATAASQLEKGVISATEYLSELNALTCSQLQYTLHDLQLTKAFVTKKHIAGQPIN